jgi:hypothetical protein
MDPLAPRVASRFLRAQEGEEGPSDYAQMVAYLNQHMKPFKKGHAWWLPPHNFAANAAIMELNFWHFTILPGFAHAYRPATGHSPEGVVIDPKWASFKDRGIDHTLKGAELMVTLAKSQPSVPDSVKKDFEHIEEKFKIQIPHALVSKVVGDSLKIAERRWGTNRLRAKMILVPFDGSKAQEI